MSTTTRSSKYRIAGEVASMRDLTALGTESTFADGIRRLFKLYRPKRLIETGTYHGTGSTTIISEALRDAAISGATFYSIEANPRNLAKAAAHLNARGYDVQLMHGLSVPRAILPTREQIEAAYVKAVEADGVFVDHQPANRAELYFKETDFPGVPDDLLGTCLKAFDYQPDFVLLDSGGHMGNVEFNYVLPLLKGECLVALDDVNHVKHYRSLRQMLADPRFKVVERSDEKFGFALARFTPDASVREDAA